MLVKGSLGLAACVLHTTTESREAAQPLANENGGLAIAFDGFLANWEELRSDLLSRGAILRNRSDAELVLRAYETWGEACVGHCDGEFAFVIADWRRQRLFGARDHLGLKPLFHYRDGDRLLLASDIAAIITALDRKPEPNFGFLASLMAGELYNAEQTAWQDLESLAHAHWLSCDGARFVTRRYYELPTEVPIRYRTDAEYAERHRWELFDAVRRSSRSCAPLAIEVSGGLDSSAIFAAVDHLHRQGELLAPDFSGYTLVGEEGTPSYEVPYARAVADHIARRVEEVPIFHPPCDWYVEQSRTDQELPPPSNGAMSFELERCASENGARVLVTGLGGDEWLGGSRSYFRDFAARRDGAGFMRALREDVAVHGWQNTLPLAARGGVSGLLPSTLRRGIRALLNRDKTSAPVAPAWLKPHLRDQVAELAAHYRESLPDNPDLRERRLRFAYPWSLYSRATMLRQPASNGLELRFPFLSRQFVEFSAATPEYARMRRGINKYTHRLAMRGFLPDIVIERDTKAAFDFDDTNRMMCSYITGVGAQVLDDLVNHDCFVRQFGERVETTVDASLTWQIYGTYAAACFLEHAH
ncbi:putative asparagine synthetase [Erythrobacter dokdonensis DSW-74]|uniref:asparagine synthase (glutamine-hydrolyzing) n=2 Tax=Erythrobacter TaxID=1041 RepID=A0A1A7BFC7_9SPHN|nr:putative asparagine synthetase [Erythrobacter dokdonensis DSW-74]